MAEPSKNFHSSHQPNSDDDDEAIGRKHLSRKKNKTAISSSVHHSTTDAEPSNLSTICNLSPSQRARITEPFNHCLIARVVGRKVSAQFLVDRLYRFLPLTGTLAVTELGRGFFVLKFSLSLDYNEALKGRPWSIPNICITVFPWIPNFRPSETAVPYVDVWIRLPELCIEYYDKEVLQQIAEAIGSLVKIDPITERLEKCKFARLCIKVNLCNPLPSEIKLGTIRQKIEYEGLYLLCSHCRRVDGDLKHDCLTNPFGSGFDTHHHKAYSYQHPNCRQNQAIGSTSKQPLIPSEQPSPLGSRFQVLKKDAFLELSDRPSLPMSECATAATATTSVNVAPKLAQKKYQLPGLKAKAVANQKVISGFSVQTLPDMPKESAQRIELSHTHPLSISSNLEASSVTIKSSEFKDNNFIQSMALVPSVAEDQFRATKTSNPTTLAVHNNQPQPSLTVSIPSPQPCPVSEASLKFYSIGIQHSTIEKEIINTPSREISVKSCPTVYTISPTVTSLALRLSEGPTTMSNQNQYDIDLVPTSRCGNEYGIGSEAVSASCSKKMLCWNYSGRTNNIRFIRALKDLIQLHEPSIVLIFGTKMSGADADQVVQELAFCGSYCRKPDGYSGGIWLLLSQQDVQVQVNSYSSQQISASLYFHSETKKPMHTETPSQPWGPTFFYTSPNLINNTLAC